MRCEQSGYLDEVNFDEKLLSSPFIRAMRMHFKRVIILIKIILKLIKCDLARNAIFLGFST